MLNLVVYSLVRAVLQVEYTQARNTVIKYAAIVGGSIAGIAYSHIVEEREDAAGVVSSIFSGENAWFVQFPQIRVFLFSFCFQHGFFCESFLKVFICFLILLITFNYFEIQNKNTPNPLKC